MGPEKTDDDEFIERLERRLADKLPPEQARRALERTGRALSDGAHALAVEVQSMLGKLVRIFVLLLVVVIGGVWLWRTGIPWLLGNSAFREAQAAMQARPSLTCRQTFSDSGPGGRVMVPGGRLMILDSQHWRVERLDGSYRIVDTSQSRTLSVYPEKGKARLEKYVQANVYELLRSLKNDFSVRTLPRTDLDGREVLVFFVPDLNYHEYEATLWVDPDTKLPVRIEAKSIGKQGDRLTILDEFDFHPNLEPSDFWLEPPAGYRFMSQSIPIRPLPADPQLRDPVVTPLVGIGPVKFGMSTAEVETLLGEPDDIDDRSVPSVPDLLYMSYHSRGILIKVSKSVGVIDISCESYHDTTRGRSFGGETDRDIAFGASKRDVIRAYGEPSWTNPWGTFLEYNRLGASFHFYNDRLTSMWFFDAQRWSARMPSAAFSPDGRTLAVLDGKGTVGIWNVTTGKRAKEMDLALGPEEFAEHPLYTPDGDLTVLLCRYNRSAIGPAAPPAVSACLWNVTTAKRSPFIEIGHGGIATSRKGEVLAYASELWEVATAKKLCEVALLRGSVAEILFSPDGRIVVYRVIDSSSDNSALFLANVTTGKEVLKIGEINPDNKGRRYFFSPQFSADGKRLAFSERGQPVLHIWDLARGKAVDRIIVTESKWETALGFSPDGQTLVSWDRTEGSVRLWETATGKEHHAVDVGRGVDTVILSPAGNMVALLKDKAVEFRSLMEPAWQEP